MSNSEQLENFARAFLRSSEQLKATVETFIVNEQDTNLNGGDRDSRYARLMAIVTHWNDRESVEEGSMFIFKAQPGSTLDSGNLTVHRTLPIIGNFSIAMAQARRGTLDLTSKAALSQPRSEFTLTITPDDATKGITLVTNDVQRLKIALVECKRIKAMSDPDMSLKTSYTWLTSYIRTSANSVFSSAPPDLRAISQPPHTRLSAASAGLPGDDISDINIVREDWVRSRALETARDTTALRIRVGTFNVNGKLPSQDLSAWVMSRTSSLTTKEKFIPPMKPISPLLLSEVTSNPSENAPSSTRREIPDLDQTIIDHEKEPDLLILGFQELDLSTEALIYSTSTTKEDAWYMAVLAGLGETAMLYEKLASKQLVGMLLIIIAKKSIRPCFSEIKTAAVGSGIMGVMGNKGGTAIRVSFTPPSKDVSSPLPTILTFVNAHLAAFDEMVDRRNSDFHDLSKRLVFDATVTAEPSSSSIFETDALFWMGDLNYRIDLSDADVRELLASEVDVDSKKTLLQFDQLTNAIAGKKAFEYFKEHPITHLPSYRFSVGLISDNLGYDLKRKPAWTDRILHIPSARTPVQQLSYQCHKEITMSDHRPVSANFVFRTKVVDKNEQEAAIRELYHKVASFEESESVPKVKLDSTSIEFGKIYYNRKISKAVKIQNIGTIPCLFRFIPLDSNTAIHPDWLRIEPMTGLLLPRETTPVAITIEVDNTSASRLNLGPTRLEETLILHTALGKDHFISIAGEYQHTCFANSLARLVRLPGPIRSSQPTRDLLPEDRAANAPKEIMRLINWMMSNTTDDALDHLFFTPAVDELVDTIRECLDTGSDFPFASPPDRDTLVAFSHTLLRLLDSLSYSLVPPHLHARCIQATSREEAFELLDAFPGPSVNVWISVTAFLHYVAQERLSGEPASSSEGRKAERLAALFAAVLLRDTPKSYPPVSPIGKRAFLLHFIES